MVETAEGAFRRRTCLGAVLGFLTACGPFTGNQSGFGETQNHFEARMRAAVQEYCSGHPDLAPEIKAAILSRDVVLGMTEEQVVLSIGSPWDVNRTTTADGTSVQFVYEDPSLEYSRPKYRYVYFENGHVTAWQR